MVETKTPNWEIAVYALYLLDGAKKSVHTEDISLKCFEIAPGAFSWIRHGHLPDKEVTRSSLVDARKPKYGRLVIGRAGRFKGQYRDRGTSPEPDGWRLTQEGVKWVLENQARLESGLGNPLPHSTRQEALKAIERIRRHTLYQQFELDGSSFVPSLGELASMLRCRVDAEDRVWASRFLSLRNQAEVAGENVVVRFLERCAELRPALT